MDRRLSSMSGVPALLLASDVDWPGDALSLGLQDLRRLSPSLAVMGCDGEGTEEMDGGLCVSELQEACSSDPHVDRAGTEMSSPAATPLLILFELQADYFKDIIIID